MFHSIENISFVARELERFVFETRTTTGRRIKLTLAHFDANVSTVRWSVKHFKQNRADLKRVMS